MSISNKCKLFQDVDNILLGTVDYSLPGRFFFFWWGEGGRRGAHVAFRGNRTGSVVANREKEYNEGPMENRLPVNFYRTGIIGILQSLMGDQETAGNPHPSDYPKVTRAGCGKTQLENLPKQFH